jgi:uncharacterized protein (TIGR00251 family)
MIVISEHPEGSVLPVRAQPGARRDGLVGVQAGSLKIAVTAPPHDGRANLALLEVLRTALKLRRSQVSLISGATSREKRFLIRGLMKADLEERVASLLG